MILRKYVELKLRCKCCYILFAILSIRISMTLDENLRTPPLKHNIFNSLRPPLLFILSNALKLSVVDWIGSVLLHRRIKQRWEQESKKKKERNTLWTKYAIKKKVFRLKKKINKFYCQPLKMISVVCV